MLQRSTAGAAVYFIASIACGSTPSWSMKLAFTVQPTGTATSAFAATEILTKLNHVK